MHKLVLKVGRGARNKAGRDRRVPFSCTWLEIVCLQRHRRDNGWDGIWDQNSKSRRISPSLAAFFFGLLISLLQGS
jgi:hypothetical protein